MGKHNSRNNKTGRFAKMNPVTDVVAPDAGTPTDFAYGEVRCHAPAADELAQGGEQHLAGRSPIEINGDTGESFGRRMEDVPGLPAEIFGGRGVVRHDVAHGGHQRPLPHRRQIVIDAHSGQQLSDHITDVRAVDARSNFGVGDHVVSVEDGGPGGEFSGASYPHYDGPDTMRGYRRIPGTDGYKLPAMGQSDRDAEWKGGR